MAPPPSWSTRPMPSRRIQPDAARTTRSSICATVPPRAPSALPTPRTVQPHASKGTVQNAPPALAGAQPACPFCTASLPPNAARPARCGACASPLTPPPPAERLAATRRSFERHTIQTAAEYFAPGDATPRPATLADFSPRGARLAASDAARAGLVLALKTPLFDALARVVASEPARGRRLLRLEFLTLALTASTGSLVSTQA